MRRVTPQLAVDSMDESLAFWRELGFEPASGTGPESVVIERGDDRIELWPRETLGALVGHGDPGALRSTLSIGVESITSILELHPAARPIELDTGPACALADPSGNVLVVFEHHEPRPRLVSEAQLEAAVEHVAGEEAGVEDGHLDAPRSSGVASAAPAEPARVETSAPPHVVRLVPETIAVEGGTVLSIFGTGLDAGSQVFVESHACPVRAVDGDRLEVVCPRVSEGPVVLEVRAPDGQATRVEAVLRARHSPVVLSVTPSEGDLSGGAVLTIVGRHFAPGSRVTFFDRAPEAKLVSETELQIVCPPRDVPGTGAVRVHSPEGLTGELRDAFTYKAAEAPAIGSVSPTSAWCSGGLHVTIAGAHFRPGVSVELGGTRARVVSVALDKLVFEVPAVGEVRTVDVVVENPDGQRAVLPASFSFERTPAPPKLIEVMPRTGVRAGGQTLRLVGDNFDERTVVRIGEVTAPVRFLGKTALEVTTPPGAAVGPAVVELSDRQGIVVRFEGLFAYEDRPPPIVASVTPPSGFPGHRVRIEGHHFGPKVTVRFGRETAPHAIVHDESTLDATVPPSRHPGVVDVTVISDGGEGVLKAAFRYETLPAPVIESIAPNAGSPEGGTELSIEGKNFVRTTRVLIGGKPAQSIKLVDATTLEIKTPPGASGQLVDVVVQNPDGAESLKRRAFLYDPRYA